MPSPSKTESSKVRTLVRRSLSSVGILVVLAVVLGIGDPRVLLSVFSLMALAALGEYFRFFPDVGFRRFRFPAFLVAVGYLGTLFFPTSTSPWVTEAVPLSLAALFLLMIAMRVFSPLEGLRTLHEITATIFGFVYCILLFSFIPKIFLLPLTTVDGGPTQIFYILHFIALTKMSDTGAYLVGSAIGKDKLVPHISPGKTWQGFWGAIAFAVISSYLFLWMFGPYVPLIGPISAGVLGLCIALVAVLGDLAESIMKRSLEVKDSGSIMPGIGGILDLVDSLILTAPMYYLFLRLHS